MPKLDKELFILPYLLKLFETFHSKTPNTFETFITYP